MSGLKLIVKQIVHVRIDIYGEALVQIDHVQIDIDSEVLVHIDHQFTNTWSVSELISSYAS